uniref:nucleotidyltransferase family protein n=1 Tax=Coprococcus sp. TaxID=2049024 RepID=UPI004026A78C
MLIDEPASFSACLKNNLAEGMSYPSARADAIKSCCPAGADLLKEPNNILAVEYLSALKKTRSSIKPYIIKRTSAGYNSEDITGSICSASAIRHLLQQISTDHTEEPDALFKTFYQVLPAASADLLKTEYLHTYPAILWQNINTKDHYIFSGRIIQICILKEFITQNRFICRQTINKSGNLTCCFIYRNQKHFRHFLHTQMHHLRSTGLIRRKTDPFDLCCLLCFILFNISKLKSC